MTNDKGGRTAPGLSENIETAAEAEGLVIASNEADRQERAPNVNRWLAVGRRRTRA